MTGTGATYTDVAIIGAGIAGIAMGIRLKRRGIHSFQILERANEVGGTWRDNTYPGVACDVPSHLYAYSFRPNPDWSAHYAPGAEIQRYLATAAREEGLLGNIRFGTDVVGMTWREAESHWVLESSSGVIIARTLVLAAGRLSEPRIPEVPGIDGFPGEMFHSARWAHGADLTGKRVAVIGSGASAIQLVPRLAELASSLLVLQRSPPYVIPRDGSIYSAAERTMLARDPDELARLRASLFWKAEEAFAQRTSVPADIAAARSRALGHLEAQVVDPALRARLRPGYEIGCKRVLISSDFYPALTLPHVTLEASALAAIERSTLVAANGSRHEVDVVVFATGFHAAEQPYARNIMGRDGETLAEHWASGMTSAASTVVSGFPNLFIINGPNAGLGHNSAIYMIETQVDYILGALQHQAESGGAALAAIPEAEAEYTSWIDALSSSTVWMTGGCTSWYVDSRSGRLTLLWPDFAFAFREANGAFDPSVFDVTGQTSATL